MHSSLPLRRASSESTLRTYFPLAPLSRKKLEPLDSQKSSEFLSHITSALNDSATCLQLSIGHQLKLVQRLHREPHITAATLAKELNLCDRYVQEWMCGMVCADIQMPRSGGLARIIPALARAEGELIQSFRDGRTGNLREVDEIMGQVYPCGETLLKLYPGLGDNAHVGVVAGMRTRLVEDIARLGEGSWFSVFTEIKRRGKGNLHWCEWKEFCGKGYLDVVLVVDGAELGRRWDCVEKLREGLKAGGVLLFVDVCGDGVFGGTLGIANGGCGGRDVVKRRLEQVGFDVVDVHMLNEMCYVIVAMLCPGMDQ